MAKVGIITIIDNNNYGNRLQNYAVQFYINKLNNCSTTLNNIPRFNKKRRLYLLRKIKYDLKKNKIEITNNRLHNFYEFNKNINFSKKMISLVSNVSRKYDYFVVGSDQVWNPNFLRFRDVDLLSFAKNNQKISFSASFGISNLPDDLKEYGKKHLKTFKAISVRENRGKELVEEMTGRKDVQVLIDPTMLLTSEEWDKVSKKPKMLKNDKDKYILNYFLGELSESRKKEIKKIAKKNNCQIINLLDKNNPFYECGPSEFLYLEKHAFLICTDSFHSSVFAILYDRPFIIFDREEKGVENMGSRLDTLISKFKLKNRRYNGKNIMKENLTHDYTEAYKILEKERKKSDAFLKKALDIKDVINNE